jgi:hypothetical protein
MAVLRDARQQHGRLLAAWTGVVLSWVGGAATARKLLAVVCGSSC